MNGTPISENQVNILVMESAKQGKPDTPELRKDIIDQLSMQSLVSQEAVKKGLDKVPEVQDQIDITRHSILTNAFIQDYLKNNPISDDTLKAEYERIKGQMTGSEYKARHILVAKESEAKDIIAKLRKNPKSFESLAKERSLDAGSKANGGELGWFDSRAMVPEFAEAVAKLGKGQFSEVPVKSQFGYHVVLLEDSRPKMIPPFDQVKSVLQQKVQQQNLKKVLDDLKANAKIIITEASAPAVSPPMESKAAEKR